MLRKIGMILLFLGCFLHPVQAQEVDYANLEVRVEGIGNQKGEIGVALFNNPKGYPTHLEHAYSPKWMSLQGNEQTVTALFEGLPFGDYAISIIHDVNGNRSLDVDPFGFPKEGVGFSNNQKVILSAPSFSASKFSIAEAGDMKVAIPLDYRK